ncbi:MAG: hypothetical protein PGN09_07750 [Sphingomonas fennica]
MAIPANVSVSKVAAFSHNQFPCPLAAALDTVERDDEVDEVARLLVRGEPPGRAVRVQITMEEGLLARIDRATGNRSRFLADAARAARRA